MTGCSFFHINIITPSCNRSNSRYITGCGEALSHWKMVIRPCIQALFRCMFIVCFGGIFTLVQRSDLKWDYLVYTQIWPQTLCMQINETAGKCLIPDNVKSWTIHGLWPSVHTTKEPAYCNDSWPFRPNEIEDIKSELEVYWPNIIIGEVVSSLWKHEWTKHGTCATSLQALDSEHKYFEVGLELRKRFNLEEILTQAGIYPSSSETYKLQDFHNALSSVTKCYSRILCMKPKLKMNDVPQLLAQIEICYDKEFNVIDCDQTKFSSDLRKSIPKWDPYPYFPKFDNCDDNVPIAFFPIVHSKMYQE